MRNLCDCPPATLCAIDHVFTDIDDTLTTNGRLTAAAYSAMEALQNAGMTVIPITGRPAGWCDLIARQWPVSAVVGENGAFYFRHDDERRQMSRQYFHSSAERRQEEARLAVIRDLILTTVPGAALSADQAYREADLAIDFCEDVPPLSREAIQQIVEIFEHHGAIAKISSIHVNGWFGNYDKLSMTRRLMLDQFAVDITEDNDRCLFAGDSPNDAPMFGFFNNSIGVANVMDQIELCAQPPKWVSKARAGAGFVELAQALLDART